MRVLILLAILCCIASCSSVLIQHDYSASLDIDKESYVTSKYDKGVVLVSTSGSRVWGCGEYENAELRSIGFDKHPLIKSVEDQPDLVINSTPDGYVNYAFLLEPGTYGISYISIKVSRSVSEVGSLNVGRDSLIEDDKSKGGYFSVKSGESVYIGHFALDCAYGPSLWRYYLEDQESFQKYIHSFKKTYPYLNLNKTSYRLFETDEFGHKFSLPQ